MRSLQEEAQRFLKNGLYREAEAICSTLTVLYPFDLTSWHLLGIAHYFQGNIQSAEKMFDIAIRLDKEAVSPVLWKIECLLKTEQKEQAISLFSQIEKEYTTRSDERLHIQQIERIVSNWSL